MPSMHTDNYYFSPQCAYDEEYRLLVILQWHYTMNCSMLEYGVWYIQRYALTGTDKDSINSH